MIYGMHKADGKRRKYRVSYTDENGMRHTQRFESAAKTSSGIYRAAKNALVTGSLFEFGETLFGREEFITPETMSICNVSGIWQ